MRKYREKDIYKNRMKEYRENNREKLNADRCVWQKEDKERDPIKYKKKYRRENLLRRYGLTVDTYNLLYAKHDGKCGICNKEESALSYLTGRPQRLAIDHDHATGKVRGLLCFSCNRALGYFKDNSILLQSAIRYLKENTQ